MRATRRTLTALLLAGLALAGLVGPALAKPIAGRVPVPRPPASSEVAGWSARRLAAQLVFCSVPAANPLAGRRFAKMGVGGTAARRRSRLVGRQLGWESAAFARPT